MTPPAVQVWIDTVFRDGVVESCGKPELLGMIKVGADAGHDAQEIMARFVSAVVHDVAGLDVVGGETVRKSRKQG